MKLRIECILRTVNIIFKTVQPRATICRIGYMYNGVFDYVYGIAVRTKTDKEDPEIGKALAYKRAVKALHKTIAVIDRPMRE